MMMSVGRSIPLLCATILLAACSQGERAWNGLGTVLGGDMQQLQQQQQEDHQRLAKAFDRLDASDQDRAQVRRDLEQIRDRLKELDELRARQTDLARLAETVADLRRRLDAVQTRRPTPPPQPDPVVGALRHIMRSETGIQADASPSP